MKTNRQLIISKALFTIFILTCFLAFCTSKDDESEQAKHWIEYSEQDGYRLFKDGEIIETFDTVDTIGTYLIIYN